MSSSKRGSHRRLTRSHVFQSCDNEVSQISFGCSQGISAFTVANFYQSVCYESYLAHKVTEAVAAAQGAKTNQERISFLQPVKDVRGHPAEMSDKVCAAFALFDEKVELSQRVAFLHKNKAAQKMAIEWDATGPVGATALLLQETPDLCKMKYPVLRAALGLLRLT